MQQEDDLRGLAKTMEFMRAVSIIFVVIHIYYYCFGAMVRLDADIDGDKPTSRPFTVRENP
jgi:hypothetical protein